MIGEYWPLVSDLFVWCFTVIGHSVNLTTLMMVILGLFILPLMTCSLVYLDMMIVYVYGYFKSLMNPSYDINQLIYPLALFSYHFGRLWHGYEIEGMENVPSEGAALMVCYHGPLAFDVYFMTGQIYLMKNRIVSPIMDRIFFRFPGWGKVLSLIHATEGSVEGCVKSLNDGHLLSVAPGGAYEGVFNENNYRLRWRNRIGYAKVAIQAKSPIIPVFTVNIREAYRGVAHSLFEKMYLKWKIPFAPMYGGFPVKLRTIIGKPIAYDPALTAEELNRKVMMSVEQLIKDNQRLPGSMAMALLDRFRSQKKLKAA